MARAERGAISRRAQEGAGGGEEPRAQAAISRNADRHARDLAPVVEDVRAGGATSLRAS
jgi:hypothetical protein